MKKTPFQLKILHLVKKYSPLLLELLRKKCPYSDLYWSVFSRIGTE